MKNLLSLILLVATSVAFAACGSVDSDLEASAEQENVEVDLTSNPEVHDAVVNFLAAKGSLDARDEPGDFGSTDAAVCLGFCSSDSKPKTVMCSNAGAWESASGCVVVCRFRGEDPSYSSCADIISGAL